MRRLILGALLALASCGPIPALAQPQGATAPSIGAPKQITVTCGATSTTLLAPLNAAHDVLIQNPSTASSKVWVEWDGNAAVTGLPSYELDPGAGINLPLGGDLWNGATIACIATVSQGVSVTYR